MHPIDALAKTVPLDPAEEALLLTCARGGDTDAKETLVEHYILYALKVARQRFAHRKVGPKKFEDEARPGFGLGEHEIYEIASDGLLDAIEKFDPARSKQRFSTLVAYYVGFRGLNLLRTFRRNKEDTVDSEKTLYDDAVMPQVAHNDLWKIRMTEFEAALAKESALVQNIVRRHLDGDKFETLAQTLGYKSTTSVQKRFNDFVSKFQEDFQKRYPEYYGANQ